MVVAVAKALVVRVLNSLEEIVQKYPKIAADTLIQRTNYIVQDMAKKDLYPDHLFQLHAPVGSPIGSLITFPDII
jgi:hypothetical protein